MGPPRGCPFARRWQDLSWRCPPPGSGLGISDAGLGEGRRSGAGGVLARGLIWLRAAIWLWDPWSDLRLCLGCRPLGSLGLGTRSSASSGPCGEGVGLPLGLALSAPPRPRSGQHGRHNRRGRVRERGRERLAALLEGIGGFAVVIEGIVFGGCLVFVSPSFFPPCAKDTAPGLHLFGVLREGLLVLVADLLQGSPSASVACPCRDQGGLDLGVVGICLGRVSWADPLAGVPLIGGDFPLHRGDASGL